jgi:hypothetical protein
MLRCDGEITCHGGRVSLPTLQAFRFQKSLISNLHSMQNYFLSHKSMI